MTQRECDLTRLAGARFEVDMKEIELEKALRGLADCTCFHFELEAGLSARVTIMPPLSSVNAEELFALFVEAARAEHLSVELASPEGAWPPRYRVIPAR